MAWDYSKLRGKIKEVCVTQNKFSQELGICRVSLSQRLNNKSEFTQTEICKACKILGIDIKDIATYFFMEKV